MQPEFSLLILVNRARLDLIVYCCTYMYLFGEFVQILSLCYMFTSTCINVLFFSVY